MEQPEQAAGEDLPHQLPQGDGADVSMVMPPEASGAPATPELPGDVLDRVFKLLLPADHKALRQISKEVDQRQRCSQQRLGVKLGRASLASRVAVGEPLSLRWPAATHINLQSSAPPKPPATKALIDALPTLPPASSGAATAAAAAAQTADVTKLRECEAGPSACSRQSEHQSSQAAAGASTSAAGAAGSSCPSSSTSPALAKPYQAYQEQLEAHTLDVAAAYELLTGGHLGVAPKVA